MSETIRDSYLTLGASCRHEIKIKGSRFIALGYPIADEKAAVEILDNIRKQEYAASHHCFAYVVGLEQEKFKYSDDGEPSGTAGRPIYQAVVGKTLKNVLVVVVRYFGGTKLGVGGLTRAYSQAAGELLNEADITEILICDRLRLAVPFSFYDRLMGLISRGNYRIGSQDFADIVTIEIEIRKSQTEAFISQIAELTGGRIDVTRQS